MKRNFLKILLTFLILFSISNVYANSPTDLNEKETLPEELLNDLNLVKLQLLEQDALEQYQMFEDVIINNYFDSSDNQKSIETFQLRASSNNKVRQYRKDSVDMRETYLTPSEVAQLYDALSAPDIKKSIVSSLMGSFSSPFGLTGILQDYTVRKPLYDLKEKNLPGLIIESIDRNDLNRYTIVVSRWYGYPKW